MLRKLIGFTNIFESNILDKLEFNENSNKVFIYIVSLSNCKLLIPQFWECLSAEERTKANKYYTSDLSDLYIISHGILRCILSYYTKQLPQEVEFIHNKYGKPFLKNHNFQFNMSHSHDIVNYIIALDYKVGIDIEVHNNTLDIQEFSDLVFTPAEHEFFTVLEAKERLEFFYNLWTKKESLIKACGQGREQIQIRHYVTYRKNSYFTQSERGNRFLERIISLYLTWKQQNQNPVVNLQNLLIA